jgi:hypothetical protein
VRLAPWNRSRYFFLRLVLSIACTLIWAAPALAGDVPTVTFSLNFPGSEPERYSISVHSDGRATYECSAKVSAESEDREEYQTNFVFSGPTSAKIFDLTARVGYFQGKLDNGNKKLAFTGAKILAYKDGQKEFSAEYNVSAMPAVQELTTLFQSVAATLDFGRRLIFMHQYQKLALDDELKSMEEEARRGQLAELQAVRPILQQIYEDSSVINIDRARAARLIQMGESARQ